MGFKTLEETNEWVGKCSFFVRLLKRESTSFLVKVTPQKKQPQNRGNKKKFRSGEGAFTGGLSVRTILKVRKANGGQEYTQWSEQRPDGQPQKLMSCQKKKASQLHAGDPGGGLRGMISHGKKIIASEIGEQHRGAQGQAREKP